MVPVAISPGLKPLGSEADHSFPPTAEAKKSEPIPPLPYTYSWRGAELIKRRNNLPFTCMYMGLYSMRYLN
jgi:hypothetical protein